MCTDLLINTHVCPTSIAKLNQSFAIANSHDHNLPNWFTLAKSSDTIPDTHRNYTENIEYLISVENKDKHLERYESAYEHWEGINILSDTNEWAHLLLGFMFRG